MIEVEKPSTRMHQLVVAQVHKRTWTSSEKQSTYADIAPLHNFVFRYYMFLSTHILHSLGEYTMPSTKIISLDGSRREKKVIKVAKGCAFLFRTNPEK